MANPQPTPFAPISVELFRAIGRFPFTARQYSVLIAVMDACYGGKHKSKTAEITIAELSERAGLHDQHSRKTVGELVKIGALIRVDLGKKRFALGIQKDYERWTLPGRISPQVPNQFSAEVPNQFSAEVRTNSVRKCEPNWFGSRDPLLIRSSDKTYKTDLSREVVPRTDRARDQNERKKNGNRRPKKESIIERAHRLADEQIARLLDPALGGDE